jgi:hypothetical protein
MVCSMYLNYLIQNLIVLNVVVLINLLKKELHRLMVNGFQVGGMMIPLQYLVNIHIVIALLLKKLTELGVTLKL